MPRSQLADIVQIILGLFIGIFVVLLPGYGISWVLNLLSFRERSWLGRVCLSAPLGIALLPILIYLSYRFLSVSAAVALVALLAFVGLVAFLRTWKSRALPPAAIIAVACVWIMIAIFSLVDIDTDGRVYNSSLVWDHDVRVQTVAALSHCDRLPLTNYLFYPGRTLTVRYHYFSYFYPSFIQRISLGAVSANAALNAYIVWVGLALLATIASYLYLFIGSRDWRAVLTAWLLLGVGGLQVIPFLKMTVERMIHGHTNAVPYPSLTFWNNAAQVTSWLDSFLWVPNHVSSLIALLMGCLLLWDARDKQGRERTIAIVLSGVAFASGVGLSVYVCLMFAAFLATLSVYLYSSYRRQALMILAAGMIGFVFALPFLAELIRNIETPSLFAFWIREFDRVSMGAAEPQIRSQLMKYILSAVALPIVYFVEMGLYFVVAVWWAYDRFRRRSFTAQEKLLLYMVGLSFLLCSFIRSFPANDFGWRGLLPAQFALVLAATDLFLNRPPNTSSVYPIRWRVAVLCVVIGVATTFTELLVLRTHEPLADAGLALTTYKLNPTPATGLHNAQLRSAYDWIRRNTAPDAIVQQNPAAVEEVALGLYSERRTSVFGRSYALLLTSNERDDFVRAYTTISQLYRPGVSGLQATQLCGQAALDYIVVQDVDPVWQDQASYVWSQPPVFATPLVRVFHCGLNAVR